MRLVGLKVMLTALSCVALTATVSAVGMTLYGLLCGAIWWAIRGPEGLAVATLGRFFVAGMIAGAIAGAGIAWDRAVNSGPRPEKAIDESATADRGRESANEPSPAQPATPVPSGVVTRHHGWHGLNGGP